jgi:hypothetical protein
MTIALAPSEASDVFFVSGARTSFRTPGRANWRIRVANYKDPCPTKLESLAMSELLALIDDAEDGAEIALKEDLLPRSRLSEYDPSRYR